MDPLSAAASIVALLQLTGSVIKYLHGVKNASDDIKCLTLELCTMKGLLSTLEDTLDAVDPMLLNLLDGPDGVFKQLRSTLEQLLSKTGSAPSNNLGKLLRFPFKKGDIDNSLSSVERQKGVLSLILQGNHLQVGQAYFAHSF